MYRNFTPKEESFCILEYARTQLRTNTRTKSKTHFGPAIPILIPAPLTSPPSASRKLHQQFESYKDQVKKMGDEKKPVQDQKSEAPTCGICHKTKFADGCGHLCSYCQTKFCARCGGRVSLRSNKVTTSSLFTTLHLFTCMRTKR